MLNRIVVFSKGNDAFDFFFFQQHGNPCPVSFPHFIVRKGYRIEPLRFHFFCFLDSALPGMEEIDKTDVVEFRRSGEVEVEEADELQVFFPSDEARSSWSSRTAHCKKSSPASILPPKPFHLLTPKPRFLRPNKSFPSGRTGKQSVVGRMVLPLFMEIFVFFRQFLQNRFDSPGNVVRRQHRLEGHVLQTAPADAAQEQVDGLVVKATEDQSFLGHRRKIFVFVHLFMDLGLFRFLFHGCNFSDFIVRQSQDFADGFTFFIFRNRFDL